MKYDGKSIKISAQRVTISKARDYFAFNQVLPIPKFKSSKNSTQNNTEDNGLEEEPLECENFTSVIINQECRSCEDLIEGCEECEISETDDTPSCTKYEDKFLSCDLSDSEYYKDSGLNCHKCGFKIKNCTKCVFEKSLQ